MSDVKKWNLHQVWFDSKDTDPQSMYRVPGELLLCLLDVAEEHRSAWTHGSISTLTQEIPRLRENAQRAVAMKNYAQRRYSRDRNETGLVEIRTAQLHQLLALADATTTPPPRKMKESEPLDLSTSISGPEALRYNLRRDIMNEVNAFITETLTRRRRKPIPGVYIRSVTTPRPARFTITNYCYEDDFGTINEKAQKAFNALLKTDRPEYSMGYIVSPPVEEDVALDKAKYLVNSFCRKIE